MKIDRTGLQHRQTGDAHAAQVDLLLPQAGDRPGDARHERAVVKRRLEPGKRVENKRPGPKPGRLILS